MEALEQWKHCSVWGSQSYPLLRPFLRSVLVILLAPFGLDPLGLPTRFSTKSMHDEAEPKQPYGRLGIWIFTAFISFQTPSSLRGVVARRGEYEVNESRH